MLRVCILDYCGSGSCPMTGCNEHSNQLPRCVQGYCMMLLTSRPTVSNSRRIIRSGLVSPQCSIIAGRSGGTRVESGHGHRQSPQFCWFSSFPLGKLRDSTSNRPRPLSSKYFPIRSGYETNKCI